MITKAMIAKLKVEIQKGPFTFGEMRRIQGMGDLYISETKTSTEGYVWLYTIEIDGKTYHTHSCLK